MPGPNGRAVRCPVPGASYLWTRQRKGKRMKAIRLRAPGGLNRLTQVEMPDPGPPGAGEIRVRLHASSLNYHDFSVANGAIPAEDGRIPMSDGAGVVEAVGSGVRGLAPGDHVVSCFFPQWQDGPPEV